MTGADVDNKFSIKCDENQSDYFDATTRQAFCDEALQNIYQANLDQFQKDQKVTDNLRVFIKEVTVSTPTSNLIDISSTSTDVPSYEQLVNIPRMSFIVDGVTYADRATLLRAQDEGSYFGQGTLYDMKYKIVNNNIECLPSGYQCNEAIISYIAAPTQIDLTNAVTTLPYTDKFLQQIVGQMAVIAGIPMKNGFAIQANNNQERMNP